MLTGLVNADLDPMVRIEIADIDGNYHTYEIVLDTGFNGYLALPSNVIRRLGMSYKGQVPMRLAIGSTEDVSTYLGAVCWHGTPRDVVVIETDEEYLLGMSLLSGSKITIIAGVDGEVTIEETATK